MPETILVHDPEGDIVHGSRVFSLKDPQERDPANRYGALSSPVPGERVVYELSSAEEIARDDEEAAEAAALPVRQAEAIRHEAERRKDVGTVISGVSFRTDDASLTRLHGMLVAAQRVEAAAGSYTRTFRTAAGDEVSVSSAAEVGALFDAAADFAGFILERSADLQGQALAGELAADFNPKDDTHWE